MNDSTYGNAPMENETREPTYQERIDLCAMQEAVYLKDAQAIDIADYLTKAQAFPKETDFDFFTRLQQIEIETLITNDGDQAADENFIVYLNHGEVAKFKTEQEAYAFYRENFWRVWDRVMLDQ